MLSASARASGDFRSSRRATERASSGELPGGLALQAIDRAERQRLLKLRSLQLPGRVLDGLERLEFLVRRSFQLLETPSGDEHAGFQGSRGLVVTLDRPVQALAEPAHVLAERGEPVVK